MATKILAQLDFSKDVKTKNIVVPSMKATVTWDNPEALKGYDEKKEQLQLQKLIHAAVEALAAAHAEIREAIEEFDESLTKKPAADKKEAEERLRTFQNTCKQIAQAQEAKTQKAVEDVWELHKKRDKALTKMNLVFSAKIALAALSLGASIAVAALSLGTLAVTIVGAAKTVASTAKLLKDFASSRDTHAKDVYSTDQTLWKLYMGPKMKGKTFRSAKEVANAVGVPFLDTVGSLESKLENFLAASARVDRESQKLYEHANGLMAEIKKAESGKSGPDNAKRLGELGRKTTTLLDQIGELAKSIDGDNAFYKANTARCKVYKEMNGKAVASGTEALAFAVLVGGIAATAKSITEVALALA